MRLLVERPECREQNLGFLGASGTDVLAIAIGEVWQARDGSGHPEIPSKLQGAVQREELKDDRP